MSKKEKKTSGPREVVDQALGMSSFRHLSLWQPDWVALDTPAWHISPCNGGDERVTSRYDTLVLYDISQCLSYCALHKCFKPYGYVLRIRMMLMGSATEAM